MTTLTLLATEIGTYLTQRGLSLATAESCTGGGLSYWITSAAGSSGWFERGFVTYSNAAKVEMLGVHPETLSTHGAVSRETAIEMALGALRHSQADISIAITGIAGPDGGTPDKPVGTIWIAWASHAKPPHAEVLHLSGDREHIRDETMRIALAQLKNIFH